MKSITVREFEPIVCNPDYKEDYPYLEEERFRKLEQFIRSGQENVSAETDILQFLKIGFRRNVGDTITASNFVGVIQVQDGTQVEILPKISLSEADENFAKTKKIFCQMLRCLKDFEGRAISDAQLQVGRMNLYETFIHMYVSSVDGLVKEGLRSSYIPVEENRNTFKGKLLVNKQIRHNLVHQERFFVSFEEYSLNRPANRIIKATLQKLKRLSHSMDNMREISRLLGCFADVNPSTNYDADFKHVKMDRTTKRYIPLMQWSKVFLKGKSFTAFSGDVHGRAILFPMEKVFESFVAKRMKEQYEPLGCQVSAQDKEYYLFDEPRLFRLRPDIVITCSDGRQIILDTKWKRLSPNFRNYGISQADMYQMYAYAHKYQKKDGLLPEVWVLYPLNDDMKMEESISFTSHDGVHVHVYFIDVEHIHDSLADLAKRLEIC